MPAGTQRRERLRVVLHVLYLIFNEGYVSTSRAELQRADLAAEGIRLTRLAHAFLPDEAEVNGLLALMLLTDARRAARSGPSGELIPMAEQDRGRWDAAAIDEGLALIRTGLRTGPVGPYQLQAAIAAVHDEAPRADATDWPQILALYELLLRVSEAPVVALNHAVALAMVKGPRAGLDRLDVLEAEGQLRGDHHLSAVRAHLLEMEGNREAAHDAYEVAANLATNICQQRYLRARAAGLMTGHFESDNDGDRRSENSGKRSPRDMTGVEKR
jgi:predicted RNA polymerase sigma factor